MKERKQKKKERMGSERKCIGHLATNKRMGTRNIAENIPNKSTKLDDNREKRDKPLLNLFRCFERKKK